MFAQDAIFYATVLNLVDFYWEIQTACVSKNAENIHLRSTCKIEVILPARKTHTPKRILLRCSYPEKLRDNCLMVIGRKVSFEAMTIDRLIILK